MVSSVSWWVYGAKSASLHIDVTSERRIANSIGIITLM